MPRRKSRTTSRRERKPEKKEETKKYVFIVMALFVLSLIVLSYSFLVPRMGFNPSLQCTRKDDLIICNWQNCKVTTDSDLTLAKVPDYAETVKVASQSGANDFAPSPVEGAYTAVLFCDNGQVISRVTVS